MGWGARSITRIAKMMNPVSFFAQCVRAEPTKSRVLFPLSYLTNKNPSRLPPFAKSKNSLKPRQKDFN